MASPTSAPRRNVPRRVSVATLFAATLAFAATGWWLRGIPGAAVGVAGGLVAAVVVAAAWRRDAAAGRSGTGTIEMKPGVASQVDAGARAAVMDGGVRAGVVQAGRSARGHRDRDL